MPDNEHSVGLNFISCGAVLVLVQLTIVAVRRPNCRAGRTSFDVVVVRGFERHLATAARLIGIKGRETCAFFCRPINKTRARRRHRPTFKLPAGAESQ